MLGVRNGLPLTDCLSFFCLDRGILCISEGSGMHCPVILWQGIMNSGTIAGYHIGVLFIDSALLLLMGRHATSGAAGRRMLLA